MRKKPSKPKRAAGARRRAGTSGPRTGWHRYFMNIAGVVATRSTCDRRYVGAVIVRDRTILSTGYNGSIRGLPHCSDVGHWMESGHCIATVHAEANAVIQAARTGVCIEGATLYVTASPCWSCFKMAANAGIRTIVFDEYYGDPHVADTARRLGIGFHRIDDLEPQTDGGG